MAVELAREAVARLAPEEMPLFGVTSRLYAENPAAVEAQAESDEVLGFGAEALAALTPIALVPVAAYLSSVRRRRTRPIASTMPTQTPEAVAS